MSATDLHPGDKELLLRLQVLEDKCEMDGSYVRAATAFLARRRIIQLLGLSEKQTVVDRDEAIATVKDMP